MKTLAITATLNPTSIKIFEDVKVTLAGTTVPTQAKSSLKCGNLFTSINSATGDLIVKSGLMGLSATKLTVTITCTV